MATLKGLCAALIIAAGWTLAGCASMSKEECLAADWTTIGVEDGARGRGADAIGRHREACAKTGITPDLAAYEEGRVAGLLEFCRPARGFEFGRSGGSYEGVCPADSESAFLDAYEDGRGYYEREQAVQETERALNSVSYSVDKVRDDIREREQWLRDPNTPDDQRAGLERKIRDLSERLGRLESERSQLLVELGQRRERLRAYTSATY